MTGATTRRELPLSVLPYSPAPSSPHLYPPHPVRPNPASYEYFISYWTYALSGKSTTHKLRDLCDVLACVGCGSRRGWATALN